MSWVIRAVSLDGAQRELLPQVLRSLRAKADTIGLVAWSISAPLRYPQLHLSLREWQSEDADLLSFDRLMHQHEDLDRNLCLVLNEYEEQSENAILQVLTRYQRLLPLNLAPNSIFTTVLAAHRALFDLSKPLVRADYDHALDTWRWLLRLHPAASLALQIAALFHDIERLATESDRRIEHIASDYLVFKRNHAKIGSRSVYALLRRVQAPLGIATRAAELVEQHEQPSRDAEVSALNDADALSFFSLNSWGFYRYFGDEHTERKVQYTLDRMSDRARASLMQFRLHPRIAEFVAKRTRSSHERDYVNW